MSVWSWEETDTCRAELFPKLSQESVRELYNRWGGIPRFTLLYAFNDFQQRLLDKAINSVNESIFKFIEKETVEVEDNPSSKTPTVTKPDKGKSIAGKEVMSILTMHYRDELLNFARASPAISAYGTTLRVEQQIPSREKLVLSNIEEIKPNMYCIPTQQNNASFDAYVSPDTFFQMTIAGSYPIVRSGLEKYINENDNFEIKFYFVLPNTL
ncbi:2930_t:CDS:2 [Paraglomus brasilianum]|uniref:2930_t:CDS:1 n=1 Tax=Paraglomus brasilianum TaxID=144538 RepID=A0A9N8W1G9_9GLOM|nr:2930_t:CDS:2 [Paraglomus brasilianum]